jgi:16S rRNA (uracil1498-N3)-methyltransferase
MPPRIDFTSPRLFVAAPLAAGTVVPLEKGQANYLLNVLRLQAGSRVLVFNGRDGEWRATVDSGSRRAAALVAEEPTRPQPPASSLTYAFAPLKHARLDYMVQKAVEMGAGLLQPVITRRTQVSRVNHERMIANAIEAAEQCGVLGVPEVRLEMRFEAWLQTWPDEQLLVFCDEEAELGDSLAALSRQRHGVAGCALLVGPEGGFDAAERRALLGRAHVLRLSLGPRILRADTAAVAALTLIQATLGDWR